MAGRYQGFLVGQGNVLSCFHGGNGGTNSNHPHHGRHHQVCLRRHGCLHQSLHAACHLHIHISYRGPQFLCLLFILKDHTMFFEFIYLFFYIQCVFHITKYLIKIIKATYEWLISLQESKALLFICCKGNRFYFIYQIK